MSSIPFLINTSWLLAEGTVGSDQFLLRYRTPLPTPPEVKSHPIRFSVLWPYGNEGEFPPASDQLEQMNIFEEHLCSAVEHEGLSVLMSVLTFDGSRHWIFYTSDVQACCSRISEIPYYSGKCPVEMMGENDPDWTYLRSHLHWLLPNENI